MVTWGEYDITQIHFSLRYTVFTMTYTITVFLPNNIFYQFVPPPQLKRGKLTCVCSRGLFLG